ncbi:MAG: right-handed parallel beta-helix repeat-containing protein, partial [Thermoguttaceae bacterium]|nr:right-handed parallel beta-helix repeat-containing protein [Thermoguttaceae bacterium]
MKKICVFALTLLAFAAASAQENGNIAPNEEKIAAVADGSITEALASWWGFNADDVTASLQAALDSGVKTLRIDKQSAPWTVTPLTIPSDIEVVIDPGVTIQANEGAFRGKTEFLFSVPYQKNVVIRGAGDDSVLLMRKSDYHKEPYEKSEWRHGICLRAVKNVRIENLVIRSTGGDGIYLGAGKGGAPCEDVTIRGVICDDNNRQGISVISAKNLLIENCVLSNTRGTAPESGIDFEPNAANECLINCVMRGCVMENNAGDGIE